MLTDLGRISGLGYEDFCTLESRKRQSFIKDERMVFSASPDFAYENGGFLTAWCLDACEEAGMPFNDGNVVVDTRVHMLKPGWFPSIPGWHCDGVPRSLDKQVDLSHPQRDKIVHYLCVVDADTLSLTEFLPDQFLPDLPALPHEGENLWGTHSKLIKENLVGGEVVTVESDHLYKFSAYDYHNTVPAKGHGWRFFFRASVNTQTKGPYNEIRQQVQTYLPYEDLGW